MLLSALPRPGWLARLLAMAFSAALATAAASGPQWRQCPPLPDSHGFASPLAGVARGAVLLAGGANFPDLPLWEGGAKVWHDRVFVLEPGAPAWRLAGRLPHPLAYGVSASHASGLICAGGGNAQQHYAEVFALDWRDGALHVQSLPALPRPVAFAAGTRVDDLLYVVGGLAEPASKTPLATAFVLDLSAPGRGWRTLPPCPGSGRFQATAAALDHALFVFGGLGYEPDPAGGVRLAYLRDVYRYSPDSGWRRLADLPVPAAAAATPAPVAGGEIFLIGGVDGALVGRPPGEFHQVPRRVQVYSPAADTWRESGPAPMARVCVSTVAWQDRWLLPSGEISAGLRSPEVWSVAWPVSSK